MIIHANKFSIDFFQGSKSIMRRRSTDTSVYSLNLNKRSYMINKYLEHNSLSLNRVKHIIMYDKQKRGYCFIKMVMKNAI